MFSEKVNQCQNCLQTLSVNVSAHECFVRLTKLTQFSQGVTIIIMSNTLLTNHLLFIYNFDNLSSQCPIIELKRLAIFGNEIIMQAYSTGLQVGLPGVRDFPKLIFVKPNSSKSASLIGYMRYQRFVFAATIIIH